MGAGWGRSQVFFNQLTDFLGHRELSFVRFVGNMTTTLSAAGRLVATSPTVPDRSDEELLLRYRDAGEREAFEELVHRYERELYGYLRRFLGDTALAEDAFQGTFLQIHLRCDQFEEGRKFRPWMYTIATNQAIDAQRRTRRHKMVSLDQRNVRGDQDEVGALIDMLSDAEPSAVEQLDSNERRTWVQAAVAALPETLRASVNLIYYQGLKYREAADVLGVPVGTVKSRLHVALLRLNEAWRRDDRPNEA